jgi:DNA-binding LacI/PurR family transcriptional regulator
MTDHAGPRSGRVTLSDVARRAEVSPALVSIVMRDVAGASDATRARIKAVAQEMGYRPDVRARSLAGQRSRLIGVMFDVGVGRFHFDLLEGLYAAAERNGHTLVLTALTSGRDERKAAQSLQDFRFDALVMLGPPTSHPILAGHVPVVVIGWHVEDPRVDVVRTSDEHGMDQAVGHLRALGHRHIAHLDGGDGLISHSRRTAYASAMHAQALGSQLEVVPGGQTQMDGVRAAHALLARSGDLPTALIAYNDDVAVGALGHLAQQQVAAPDDISVIGWDDAEAAALSPVGLTSVRQRPDELARLAIERAIVRMEGGSVPDHQIVLEPELRVRSSTSRVRRPLS